MSNLSAETQAREENEHLNFVENIVTKISQVEGDVSVHIGKSKVKPLNGFTLFFYENFEEILKNFDLSKTDLRILARVLKIMEFGNLISLSQTTIAEQLELPRQNVNRSFIRMQKMGLIIKQGPSFFINPHIIAKGELAKHKFENPELYKSLRQISEELNIKTSF